MPLNPKDMATINKTQGTPAGGKEQPYECCWSGCPVKFSRHKDADRHYNDIHDRSFDAHCPVCNKKISDARKDKQKQHMEKKHGGIDSRQPWGENFAQEQPVSSATFTSNLHSMTTAAHATLQPSESNCVLCGHSSTYAEGQPLLVYKYLF